MTRKLAHAVLLLLPGAVTTTGLAPPPRCAAGPILYARSGQLYFQDFDSLPNAPENTSLGADSWDDDVTLNHWHAETSLNPGNEGGSERMRITPGNATVGAIYSFGATGDTDRALGSIGSTTVGDVVWGAHFRNETGLPIREFTVAFYGEQWRDGGTTTSSAVSLPQRIDFQYSLDATDVHGLAFGSAVDVDALDFVSPSFGRSTPTALDGNATANRVLLGATVQSVDWQPGGELWVRWVDVNHPGADHGLGIDDFAFSAVAPEPGGAVTVPLAATAALALTGRRRRRRRCHCRGQ